MTATRKRPRTAGTALGPAPGPRRVAIYLRRSTDDEHQPFSIDAQETALTSYVKSQPGWTLTATYSDDASGASTSRPELQRALRAAQAGRYDVLLVYRVDRFSRRLSDLLDLLADLDDASVSFASATEPFDTSTSIGRMLVQLLGVFAEFERETIIDRVTSGMNTKAAKGKWAGGKRPYGYTVDPGTHKLVPVPAEAPHIVQIFGWYTRDRLGTRAIANQLTAQGVTTRGGKPWSSFQVGRVLSNPAYAGDIAHGSIYVPDAHPPIIDRDTFRRAAEIAAARSGPHQQRAASPGDYYLTSRITCPQCRCKYVGTAAHGKGGTYRYYTCFTRARYGPQACDATRIPAGTADTAVLNALAAFYAQETELLHDIITRAATQADTGHDDRQAQAGAITAQIQAKQTAIGRYHTAFENGTMDDATAGPRLRALGEELILLNARLGELTDSMQDRPEPPPPVTLRQLRDHLNALITEAGDPIERKAAIEALIHEIRVTERGLIPVYQIPAPSTHAPDQPANQDRVRTMMHSVELRRFELRTYCMPCYVPRSTAMSRLLIACLTSDHRDPRVTGQALDGHISVDDDLVTMFTSAPDSAVPTSRSLLSCDTCAAR
jgi:site-specific DNA recombinase